MSHNYPLSLSGIFFFCSLILRFFFVFFPDRFNNQETALLNSGTKAHRMDTHKGKDPHHRRAGTGDRPRDVRFREKGGRHLPVLGLSQFDPTETSTEPIRCISIALLSAGIIRSRDR